MTDQTVKTLRLLESIVDMVHFQKDQTTLGCKYKNIRTLSYLDQKVTTCDMCDEEVKVCYSCSDCAKKICYLCGLQHKRDAVD